MFTRPLSMFIFATLHLAACNGDDRRASTGASGVGGGSCGELSTARAPAVPDGLRRPDGAKLVARLIGKGSQVYTCTTNTDGGARAWTLKAPDAKLYGEDGCGPIGTHFAGPTWKLDGDGSSVVAARVASAPSPRSDSIPWLLLEATSTSGQGRFGAVTAIQRLETDGGVAPSSGCDATNADHETSVPYSALYAFYTGGTWDMAP